MKDHPAVRCHYDQIVLSTGESVETTDMVPNHSELTPYLAQLPDDKKYLILDPESGHWDFDSYDGEWSDSYELIGLDVMWSDDRGYGGCRMMRFVGGEIGLFIYVNGCSGASAPGYYVVPEGMKLPKPQE